jgi:hypothetical protein
VFVDYDRDGWLDLFVAHYVHGTTVERKKCRNPAAELDYCGPQAFPPAVARLYRNERGRRFRDVTSASGIGAAAGSGLGVLVADVNTDGWPDLYVANDGAASFLWLNGKNGTFREEALAMGLAYSMEGRPQAGMGVALADLDNDGVEELAKTNLRREGANIYKKSGGLYIDAAARMGVLGPTIAHTGFGVGFADFDHDGWLDGFVANGAVLSMDDQRGRPYPYMQRNVLLQNMRGTFRSVAGTSGPFAEPLVSRGVAFGDVDNDGDVDFVVSNNNGKARLFLNNLSKRGFGNAHWLRIRLQTPSGGMRGLQAVVRLETPSGLKQMRRVDPSGSYLSASDAVAHFGLGSETRVTALVVEWADGSRSRHSVEGIDREVRILKP